MIIYYIILKKRTQKCKGSRLNYMFESASRPSKKHQKTSAFFSLPQRIFCDFFFESFLTLTFQNKIQTLGTPRHPRLLHAPHSQNWTHLDPAGSAFVDFAPHQVKAGQRPERKGMKNRQAGLHMHPQFDLNSVEKIKIHSV